MFEWVRPWAVDTMVCGAGALAAVTLIQASLPAHTSLPSEAVESSPAPTEAVPAAATPLGRDLVAFVQPVAGYPVISPFGLRKLPWEEHGRLHAGVDIAAPSGVKVRATADGVVTRTGEDGGFGRFVEIRHPGGLLSVYTHLGVIDTSPGSLVKGGDAVGKIGSTGSSTGAHLHFEIRGKRDQPLNPALFLGRRFATAEALPLEAASRTPRYVRVAYVSYIPKGKRELMQAREAEREETALAKIAERKAMVEDKAEAAAVKIFPGATVAAADEMPVTEINLHPRAARKNGGERVHTTIDLEG